MSDGYQGMRWYKCDLHLHTPEDAKHWQDSSIRLQYPRTEEDIQEKARLFLRQCYQLGLECIAITDHNFSAQSDHRKWFLTHLVEQNGTVAKEFDKHPLIIFPGFELDIRYHVVCLFEPVKQGKELQRLSEILTAMELPVTKRMINGKPQQPQLQGRCLSLRELLNKTQNESGGIVIAAHAFSDDGICNTPTNIPDFKNNPDLYAVEVSEWPLVGKPRDILEGFNPEWKRLMPGRQPAAIRSSDAKKLENAADHAKDANVLGKRFSWIKMSRSSIESLRQAFLDPGSRICLDSKPPAANHTHVRSISIKGTKFLADQTVYFSPHLNCIIGGRGSGKSMLFESLRLGLRGDAALDLSDNSIQEAAKQINRLKECFTDSTQIELDVSHGGLQDRFLVNTLNEKSQVVERQVNDEPTVFRLLNTLIFSQEEITEITGQPEILIEFIDNLVREKLEKQRQEANVIIDQIIAAHQVLLTLKRLEKEFGALEQEVKELSRQLETRTQVQEDLKKHRAAQEAQRYLQSLIKKAEEIEKNINALTEEWEVEPPPLGSRMETFPEKTFFSQVDKNVGEAYRTLAESIRSAARDFIENFRQATSNHPDWKKVHDAITRAEERFNAACREKGLSPQEAEHLREIELQYRSKNADLQAKQAEINSLKSKKPVIKTLFNKLTQCWQNETAERRKFLDEIINNDNMPRTCNGKSIVDVSVTFAGNREIFLEAWGQLAPDRRKAAGRIWDDYDPAVGKDNIGDQLFDAFLDYIEKQEALEKNRQAPGDEAEWLPGNPVQWLQKCLVNPDDHDLPPLIRQYLKEIKIVKNEKADEWFKLLQMRIPDRADLTLRRHDDTLAGSFGNNDLSTGQKNTAILSLLLGSGNGPVFIDQPEDQLDSEFLFQELVPMIRNVRQKRQMIIVTHNANIPVNADAELVYALEAREGRGKCRTQGGLDRQEVAGAVLDIMEGSEKAFRLRKEKYHF
ncbi:MAG: hypothetical protein QG657_1538 [Acidobacteriota bacterium]|nr:hypothetical protein [Acidobacteriota bacterium]